MALYYAFVPIGKDPRSCGHALKTTMLLADIR